MPKTSKPSRFPAPIRAWADRAKVGDYAAAPGGRTFRAIECSGEAHSNPHIDNCGRCAPRWGVLIVEVDAEAPERAAEVATTKADLIMALRTIRNMVHAGDAWTREDMAAIAIRALEGHAAGDADIEWGSDNLGSTSWKPGR